MPLDQPAPAASNVGNDEILEVLRQYRSQKRICDSENGTLRNILKRGGTLGINIKALVATAKALRLEPEDVIGDLRDQLHYLSLARVPVAPAEVFSWSDSVTEKSRMADDIWTAEDAGYKAGRYSMDKQECPYEAGSELQAAWLRWYARGQEAIAHELGNNSVQQASASRARPQRRAEQQALPPPDPDPPPARGRRRSRANGADERHASAD